MPISILDCTLRDGGYVNQWAFKEQQKEMVMSALGEAGVEIVECGYLKKDAKAEKHSTLYRDAREIKVGTQNKRQRYVVMINYGDYAIDALAPQEETEIEGIRLAFHRKDMDDALAIAEQISGLGYALYLQPMVTKDYNDILLQSLVEAANHLQVEALYIVDSFGSMLPEEFAYLMQFMDAGLHHEIALGYHAHNNMQLAFSNAIFLCQACLEREVIVDASIYGIGRGAGNLNTELIADYLNHVQQKHYDTLPLLEVIDSFLEMLMQRTPWGFTPAQYLSASFDCHPSYAKYLIDKNTNHIVGIRKVLESIPAEKRKAFDKVLAEEQYIAFLLAPKSETMGTWNIDKKKKILLVASGISIEEHRSLLRAKSEDENYLLIALNHKPEFPCDYYLFSNQKRFDEFSNLLLSEKVILTNNIRTIQAPHAIIDFSRIAFVENRLVKNVAIVAINYLLHCGIGACEIAGLDGYDLLGDNYAYEETNVILDKKAMQEENEILRFALEALSSKIAISFLTPSLFDKHMPLSILGVIPARYKSSRFEGKPLCLIGGIPMIKRTYTQAKQSALLTDLVVATDSIEIEQYCLSENIPVVMTSDTCLTGTDRLAEVADMLPYDLYVNIQGDEPVIDPHAIDEVVAAFREHGEAYVAYNLYKEIASTDEVQSDTIIKVIVNEKDELLYMSRLPVPFNKSETAPTFRKQVCVYGFTKRALVLFSGRDKTRNELHEDIEILRFVDMGYKVKMIKTALDSIAVDVPSDVAKVEAYLQEKGLD